MYQSFLLGRELGQRYPPSGQFTSLCWDVWIHKRHGPMSPRRRACASICSTVHSSRTLRMPLNLVPAHPIPSTARPALVVSKLADHYLYPARPVQNRLRSLTGLIIPTVPRVFPRCTYTPPPSVIPCFAFCQLFSLDADHSSPGPIHTRPYHSLNTTTSHDPRRLDTPTTYHHKKQFPYPRHSIVTSHSLVEHIYTIPTFLG